jgi:hypothetical protein
LEERRRAMPKTEDETVKTTIRVRRALWKAVRIRAVEEDLTAEALVVKALEAYLGGKKRGTR